MADKEQFQTLKNMLAPLMFENSTAEHCATCGNGGKLISGSQETYCDHCVFQWTWREDHYVHNAPGEPGATKDD